jgi:hypothetical protein
MLAASLLMVIPLLPGHGWAALALLPARHGPAAARRAGRRPGERPSAVVRDTGRTELAYGLLLALGLALSA